MTFFSMDWLSPIKVYSAWSPGARVGSLFKACGQLEAAMQAGSFDESLVEGQQVTVFVVHADNGFCRINAIAPPDPNATIPPAERQQAVNRMLEALVNVKSATSPPISPSPSPAPEQTPIIQNDDTMCPICAVSYEGMSVNEIVAHALGHKK